MNQEEATRAGQRVASLRAHLRMSQERLAELSGVSRGYIGEFERGERRKARRPTLDAIARAFDWTDWDEMIASTELEPPVRGEIVPAKRDAIVPVFQYFRGAILTARSLVDTHPEAAKQALSAALSGWPEDDNDDDHLTPPFLKDNSHVSGWAAVTAERQLALA